MLTDYLSTYNSPELFILGQILPCQNEIGQLHQCYWVIHSVLDLLLETPAGHLVTQIVTGQLKIVLVFEGSKAQIVCHYLT